MARLKTVNTPDLQVLLMPPSHLMMAIDRAVQRGGNFSVAAAPVADQVAVRIAAAITLNLFQGGQRLVETDIGGLLKVSRAPVREALRILERERLVEFRARHGACVVAPNVEDLRDIYIVRDALYQILMQQLMDERIVELRLAFDRHMPQLAKAVELGSVDDYVVESFLLNMEMTELSRNRLVVDILTSISLRTLRYVRLGLAADPSLTQVSLQTWGALRDAIERGDVAAALHTARKRIEASRDAALRALSKQRVRKV